jgi:hypothetical protein
VQEGPLELELRWGRVLPMMTMKVLMSTLVWELDGLLLLLLL